MRLINSCDHVLSFVFPGLVLILYYVNSVTNKSNLYYPFDNCKWCETLVTAYSPQEAIAEDPVKEIKYHIATC